MSEVGQDDHGHSDHGPPRLAWIMVIPVIAAFVVAPGSLGAFAASRGATWTPAAPAQSGWPPALLSPIEGAHEVGLLDFNTRAFFDEGGRVWLIARSVSLVSYAPVSPPMSSSSPGSSWPAAPLTGSRSRPGWSVTPEHSLPKATGSRSRAHGSPNAVDTSWNADDDSSWAAVDADQVVVIPEPREPYES